MKWARVMCEKRILPKLGQPDFSGTITLEGEMELGIFDMRTLSKLYSAPYEYLLLAFLFKKVMRDGP